MGFFTQVSLKSKTTLLLSLSLLQCAFAFAQQKADNAILSVERNKIDNSPTAIVFKENAQVHDDKPLDVFTKYLGIDGVVNTMVQDYSTTTKNNVTAKRFHQYYKGIKADFATYSMSSKNGLVSLITGNYYDFSNAPSAVPALAESDAFSKALTFVDASTYMWQDPKEEQRIKAIYHNPDTSFLPKGHLVWVEDYRPGTGVSDRKPHLAWSFDIFASEPLSRDIVYVDAQTGKVLLSNSMIKHTAASGHTKYSGIVPFETANTGSTYVLYDSTRGNGVHTLNMNNGSSYGAATEYSSVANVWPLAPADSIALDAHWGAEVVYDFWKNVMGRLSYDDADGILLQYVHYQSGYNNAFWDGTEMTYGDGTGCGSGFTPLTSLDVTGHEIGHGVCQYTANLVYASESGALNEAFSDCWGATIESWGNPFEVDAVAKSTWGIGEEIKCGNPMRRMDFPKLKGQPDTYGGTNWFDVVACVPSGSNDECGVHNNSGVMNKWYYLVVAGGTGTNDLSNAYNVTGIGFAEARNILYQTELVLSSTADFALMRTTSIAQAALLYGTCSPEVVTVTNAWYAVGVGAAYVQYPAAISGSVNICIGATAVLTDPSPSGTWSSSNTAIATVGSSTGIVNGVSAGTAVITYSEGAGCDATKTVTINAFPVSTMSPAPTGILCSGGTLLLTAGPATGVTYQWKLAGSAIPGATNGTYSASVGGNYTLSMTNAAGCTSTSPTTVVTNVAPPTASITAVTPSTFCAGGSSVMNANPGAGYTYQWLLGGSPIAGATDISYTSSTAGAYSVIVTNSSGCSTTSAVTNVVVTPLPAATVTPAGATTFCIPGSVALNANLAGGMTYQWQNGGVNIVGATSSTYAATATGNYAVITTQSGCSATSSAIAVTAQTLTVAPITGAPGVCLGQTITLADATPTGTWISSNAAIASVNTTGVVTGVAVGSATISYSYTNTCGNIIATKFVSVNGPTVVAPVTGTLSVCAGSTTTLSDATSGGVWSSVSPAVATIGSTGVVTGVAAGSSQISYTVTNAFGCVSASLANINVYPLPSQVLSPAGTVAICPGGNITLNASTGGGYTYQWKVGSVDIPGATNASYAAIGAGSYKATITNAFGCVIVSDVVTVNVSASLLVTPVVNVTANPGNILCLVTAPVSFTATSVNGGSAPVYQWFVNGAGAAVGSSFTYTPASGDVVRCKLTSNNSCASPDTVSTSVDMLISPLRNPSVTITDDPTVICTGHVVNFTANPVYGGTSPIYRWTKNGINVATGPEYFYVPNNGDLLTVTLFSDYPCLLTDSANSPVFHISTHTPVPNTISVSVTQSSIMEGSIDTFVAVAPNAGGAPLYQWLLNGAPIPGATNTIYITSTLAAGDVVSCRVTSSIACANPAVATSGGVTVKITPVGVLQVSGNGDNFTLSPNPNRGSFVVEGTLSNLKDDKATIVITDLLGQVIKKTNAVVHNGMLKEQITLDNSIADGIYLVSVTSGNDRVVFHMVVGK